MTKRARLIYNPKSGREQVQKHLPKLLQVYEEAGYETSCFQTSPEPFSAMREARRCGQEGFDLIVAAGGDGTINEVVTGIAKLPVRPRLAILPAGTTNDFARALRIPRDNLVKAAKVIQKDDSVLMDIGQANLETDDGPKSKYFMNIAAAGSMTELTYEVSSQQKSMFGSLAYFLKGAEMLPRLNGTPLKIEYDDGIYDGEASVVFVTLTNSVGGFEKIAPDTVMGDGKFTLIIVTTSNLVELTDLARKLLRGGKHIHDPQIIYTKTNSVRIDCQNDRKLLINLDGELGGHAPVSFECVQQHISFVADTEAIQARTSIKSPQEVQLEKELTNQVLESLDYIDSNDPDQD